LVGGISQGGMASMINALQSRPDYAIVCSGYSIINDIVEFSGHNQLIGIEGYNRINNKDTLIKLMQVSPTQWFFSWGKSEKGTYAIDANQKLTSNLLRNISNVTTHIFDGGHFFPLEAIRSFLATRL
jgi:hypothetical protein